MGVYDFFVAPLRCPRCDQVSPADNRTNIQTKLRGERAYLVQLGVGDRIAYELADAAGWGYLVVHPPVQPVHFGQMWECPYCHHYPNWAEVSIAGDRIEQIEAVPLNGATLARLHFLDEDAGAFIAEAVGRELTEAWDDLVPLLREYLETPGREL
jgi:hypothetical protein